MTEDTKKQQTTVRIEEALLKAVKRADLEKKLSLTEAVNDGIRLVLAQRAGSAVAAPDPLDGLPTKHRAALTKLIEALRSDNLTQQERDALVTNVSSALNLVKNRI